MEHFEQTPSFRCVGSCKGIGGISKLILQTKINSLVIAGGTTRRPKEGLGVAQP